MAKARKIRSLTPEDHAAVALQKIIQVRTQEVREYQNAVLRNASPEAIHDFRVAVRRLFSLLKVFGQYVPENSYEEIRSELKQLLDLFGNIREIDVFQEMVEKSSLVRKHHRGAFVRRLCHDKLSVRRESTESSLEKLRDLEKNGFWRRLESTFHGSR